MNKLDPLVESKNIGQLNRARARDVSPDARFILVATLNFNPTLSTSGDFVRTEIHNVLGRGVPHE